METDLRFLPPLNACLNLAASALLVTGYRLVKAGRKEEHKRCMLAATALSVLFLISYLTYHGVHGTTYFPHGGWLKTLYLTILWTHMPLAATVPFLAGVTIRHAMKGRWEAHRKWARRTFPIWIYVSVTGVMIYLMLYHLD